jgi:hypothetical protein
MVPFSPGPPRLSAAQTPTSFYAFSNPEMAVLESLMCPGCSTRFGLRPERVSQGIKRAQCFYCQEIFNIEAAVSRLLAKPPTVAAEPDYSAFEGIEAGDLLDMDVLAPEIPEAATPLPTGPEPSWAAVPEAAPEQAFEPAFEPTFEPAFEPALEPQTPTTLTLGDLEGADAEILDKTVVDLQVPPPPPEIPLEDLHEPEPRPGATYSSARDAINKLLGAAGTPLPHPSSQEGSGLVEATLTAMDSTLRFPARNPTAPDPSEASGAPPAPNMASTVKISSRDLMAAISSMPPPPPPEPQESQDPNLLKLQIGDETFNNLTVDTVNAWISMGRLQEHHLVARQFSDHWIEASKVPILRPAFDANRRVHQPEPPPPPPPPPPPEPAPVKRSLFGGLFGRN